MSEGRMVHNKMPCLAATLVCSLAAAALAKIPPPRAPALAPQQLKPPVPLDLLLPNAHLSLFNLSVVPALATTPDHLVSGNGTIPRTTASPSAILRREKLATSGACDPRIGSQHAGRALNIKPIMTGGAAIESDTPFTNVLGNPNFEHQLSQWGMSAAEGQLIQVVGSIEDDSSASKPKKVAVQGGHIWQPVTTVPGTRYTLAVTGAVSQGGAAAAGVTFFDAAGAALETPALNITSAVEGAVHRFSVVAPPDAKAASVWAGKLYGQEGALQIEDASFGPNSAGVVEVDLTKVIRELGPVGAGVNTNYLTDSPAVNENPQYSSTLLDTLKAMGVSAIRYPGGEKGDTYSFAAPPYTSPGPVLTRTDYSDWPAGDSSLYSIPNSAYVQPPLSIDDLGKMVAELKATPYIVLNYDSANKPGGWGYDQLKQAALAFVQYIVKMGYDIKHFEFSNESFLAAYAGYATSQQYADALMDWAPGLKAAMPGLLLGANGPTQHLGAGAMDSGTPWWQTVLGQASGMIDFLALHPYPVFGWDYSDYVSNAYNFQAEIQEGETAIMSFAAPADQQRIRIAVTETGPLDWGNKWQNGVADLGHALVTFDIMASILSHPRVDAAIMWNTRWKTGSASSGYSGPSSVADAIQDNNQPTPIGNAIGILGQFFRRGKLVQSTSFQTVRSWVVLKPGGGLTVILLNKDYSGTSQNVDVPGYTGPTTGSLYTFQGSGPEDPAPVFQKASGIQMDGTQLSVPLAATSLTVADF